MKKNVAKYENVGKLPPTALTVKEYADQNNISTSYIYKMIKAKTASFKIVVFQSINFIIPAKS